MLEGSFEVSYDALLVGGIVAAVALFVAGLYHRAALRDATNAGWRAGNSDGLTTARQNLLGDR